MKSMDEDVPQPDPETDSYQGYEGQLQPPPESDRGHSVNYERLSVHIPNNTFEKTEYIRAFCHQSPRMMYNFSSGDLDIIREESRAPNRCFHHVNIDCDPKNDAKSDNYISNMIQALDTSIAVAAPFNVKKIRAENSNENLDIDKNVIKDEKFPRALPANYDFSCPLKRKYYTEPEKNSGGEKIPSDPPGETNANTRLTTIPENAAENEVPDAEIYQPEKPHVPLLNKPEGTLTENEIQTEQNRTESPSTAPTAPFNPMSVNINADIEKMGSTTLRQVPLNKVATAHEKLAQKIPREAPHGALNLRNEMGTASQKATTQNHENKPGDDCALDPTCSSTVSRQTSNTSPHRPNTMPRNEDRSNETGRNPIECDPGQDTTNNRPIIQQTPGPSSPEKFENMPQKLHIPNPANDSELCHKYRSSASLEASVDIANSFPAQVHHGHPATAFKTPEKHEFLVRIVSEQSPTKQGHDNMWKDISSLEYGAVFYVAVVGMSKSTINHRLQQLQSDFESMLPFHRSRKHGPRITKRVEFYSFIKGKFGRVYTVIINQETKQMDEEASFVHETFSERPSFVEVTQPPGIISDLASDPPGQQSVYIPPGDVRKESYRLSTFELFPKPPTVNIQDLARHGFLYTGFYDRVKCYSCGRTVEKWQRTDRPSDRNWHKQDCLLARGLGTDNVPIGGRFAPLLTNGFRGNAASSSAPQPMEVGPSRTADQDFSGNVVRFPRDVPDLRDRGGTFQIQPGSSVVIGSSGPPRQTPAPSRPPATSRPANPSSAPPRGWRMANVISADHKRHLTNLYLNRELDRLASFGRWPTGRPNVSPVALARAAFFYLGDMDRTQCFSCGGVLRNWSYEDDAMDEHRTHFPNCRFVVGTERRNVPIPDRPETPQELADKFPCRFPMNPHMRSEASRVDTFDRRWPINRTRAKPQEIAEAGFFFLGERDRVKCWYCNGGLQNWEYDDIPWVEHAKWFPNCQFMLQRQGQLFIYRYLSLSPHLPRPIIGRQDGSTIDPVVTPPVGQSARVQDIPPAEPRARVPTPPPTIVDPQEELRKRQERVDREMENSDMVKFVLLMGYAANTIRRVLLEKLESGTPFDAQNIFEGTSPLLDAVMKMEEEIERERQEEQATNIKFPSVSSNYSALSMGSMETAPSSGQASGVYQVSGFDQHDSDDEDIDLYGSLAEQPMNGVSVGAAGGATNAPVSAGFVGTVTNGPMSIGSETRSHLWDNVPDDPESMKEFIEQKKEERLCKICFTENADMVFIPCSHMVCCKTCTEAIRQCPVCRTKIEKAIKTYVK